MGGVFNEPNILHIKVDNARHLLWSLVALGDGPGYLPPYRRGLQLREVVRLPRGRAGLRLECFNPQAFDFSLQPESPV